MPARINDPLRYAVARVCVCLLGAPFIASLEIFVGLAKLLARPIFLLNDRALFNSCVCVCRPRDVFAQFTTTIT